MKLRRIAPGHYVGTSARGATVEVTQVEGQRNWYWLVNGDGGNDWFPSKAVAVEAVIDWLKSKGLEGVSRASTTKCVTVKHPLSTFDRRSIRTVVRGSTRILIGCPKGAWQPRKQRCKVGTRAYEVITPGRCKRGSGGTTKRS